MFLCKKARIEFALQVIMSICLDQERFWLTVTPKYFAEVTLRILILYIMDEGCYN